MNANPIEAGNVVENVEVRKDFYVIAVTHHNSSWEGKKHVSRETTGYFKADRYSCYGGRLQTEWHAEDGRQYKTLVNAQKAIGRLLACKTIKPEHKPRVVRFTETLIRRHETIIPQEALAVEER